jgi:cytochrome c peroxidase
MRPAEPLPEPNGHDLPHFEAISQTPLPQLPSVVQIGFAWLPRLSGRQRQSQNPPQHACEQAPRQMALWEVGMALA